MSNDYLIGGGVNRSAGRSKAAPDLAPSAAPRVGWKFFVLVISVAGCFAAVGAWQVQRTFDARNYRMEASRLQQVATRRGDRVVEVTSRVSHLQRSESLALAGQQVLGMSSPLPGTVEQIEISWDSQQRWARAAGMVGRESTQEVP